MELRHLRYFEAVARDLSFSQAAQKLHIAQPPLSRQIRQLEDELGAQLLDRSTRPMQLTPAGRFFYEQSAHTLRHIKEVAAGARRLAKGQRTWFGVGFVPSLLYGWLPDLIKNFRLRVSDVELGLSELITVQQAEALKAGRIDVGFGRLQLDDPAITSEVLMEESLVAVLSAGHRLCSGRRLSLAHLADEPIVLYPARPRPSYADEVIKIFRSRELPIRVAMEVNELQTAVGMVAAGVGVALVPESVKRLHRNDVSYRPLIDSGVVSPVIINFRTDDQSPELARFRDLVKEVLERH
jgi:LysR family transcriptional regulator, benzoate and cis,cis-muconate-responsive activator of ben and cat genes